MIITLDEILIDPEFEQKIPPLTPEEFEQLEQNIVNDGQVINPLIIWNGTLVDGHNRYHVLEEHPEIPFSVFEKEFTDRYEAIAYICKNQLGRRNLTPEQKKYLIGKQYEAEKATHGGDRKSQVTKSSSQNENLIFEETDKTCERIAKENNVSHATVSRAEKYAAGIDAAEEVEPGIRQELLSGALRATDKAVVAIAQAEPEERVELVQQLRDPDRKKRATPSNELPDGDDDSDDPPTVVKKVSTKDILAISEALAHSDGFICGTEDDMISEMTDALENLIWRWNDCKEVYSDHVKSKSGRQRIKTLADQAMDYIKDIKKGALWK